MKVNRSMFHFVYSIPDQIVIFGGLDINLFLSEWPQESKIIWVQDFYLRYITTKRLLQQFSAYPKGICPGTIMSV